MNEQTLSPIHPVLSIIIVSYNCKNWLALAIESVKRYVPFNFEIIVVDNASVDGTGEMMNTLFAGITFIANPKNEGFSAANNQGFSVSKGEYILLLNPDAELLNTDISKAIDYLKEHVRTIIGPRILNPDRSLQNSVYPFPSFMNTFKEVFFLTYLFKPDLSKIVTKEDKYALSGACLLMHRACYAELGGLDNSLFWMDDVDLCFRAEKMGIVSLYFPAWSIMHAIGVSGKKNYKLSISNQLISKLKFFKKHGQKTNFIVSALLIEIHILLRLLIFLPLTLFRTVYRLKFLAYCHAQSLLFKYIFTAQNKTF